ncbi:Predicted nucleotidyltransferases [Cardiobacterium hominis]|uniref:Type I restriction modification DNA specificity domain protein n=1 Tax=Cardiobacterium hominis (strain ATCC 15826 / DSM 8339 / NCTC 10426 / 6573) TaxID=638300 RepID=C8NDJ8_CARH6|nr:restriction endonuclease subunit S [Cardiobacterium hominis]EEV87310.1 type I restriction modification DNA specificity domain protein [Cardiobacterium hominis ATCC 15826]VEG78375.1 Predicted nucleotidyltransferases [Cardiobacterium hominis]
MKEELKIKFLSDLIDFKNGKSIKPSSGDIPIYGGNGILGYSEKYNYNNILIIGRVGAYCGSIHYHKEKCWVSDNAIAGEVKSDYSIDYLYYLMKSLNLNDRQVGSSQPLLTQGVLNNISVKIYESSQTQQSIAAVLSALDKKIALNKQINARLEEMAKTLYDYWFVQFDFPDANGKPYKSSGGEMVFDETLKREIPKGWEVKSLGEIASTSSGGTPTSTIQEYYKGGNIPWINSGELNNNFIVHTDNFITQTGMDNSSAKLVSEKSILLAMYGATAGKTSLISFKTTTNQAICSILPKDMNHRVYIKSYLDNMYLYLVQLSSGSARDNLSQDKIKRLHLVIPESGILEIFSKVTEDFYKKIETNLKQSHHLTQLRDFLLPMLMNGQVFVAK